MELSTRSDHEKNKKLKQMELSFARILDPAGQEEVPKNDTDKPITKADIGGEKPTKKRRQTLKQLAASNVKLTSWVKTRKTEKVNKKQEECEVDDDDWPEVEDPAVIIRKEIAKEKVERVRYSLCAEMSWER